MSKFSALSHIVLIVIAVAIGILFIKPTVQKIGEVEDKTALYKEEAQKVSEVNQLLAQKLSVVDSVTPADKDSLLRYLPDEIDDISVMKDIVAIFTRNAVDVSDIKYQIGDAPSPDDATVLEKNVVSHNFAVTAIITYDQMVSVLRALEVNNYLLQVSSIKLVPDDIGQLKLSMVLTAFTKVPRADISSDVVPQI